MDIRSSGDQAQNKPSALPQGTPCGAASRRRRLVTWYVALVLIWTIGGMSVWTGALKPLSSRPGGQPVAGALAPFAILTWPAHEAALHLEGKGLGANSLCRRSPSSLLAFVLWSAILWAPLLLRLRRTIPFQISMTAQLALLLLAFALFWKYGNG